PRVSAQGIFTDNLFFTPANRRSDFITSLSPGIGITGESARFQAKLDYSPSLFLYALTPSQNFIGQNLYANGNLTIVPDLFFLDTRGYATFQPTLPGFSGGLSPSGASFLGSPSLGTSAT